MKQEASKKSRIWLWLIPVLIALLAAVGVALALLLPGQQENIQPESTDAELYWNVDRAVYTENAEVAGMSTRQAAADGKFYVRFAYEGQQLELQVIDKQLINYIDSMDVMGLVFDADGVVVDAVAPETVATKVAGDFYVREVKEGSAVLNSSIAMNGMDVEIAITEKTAIYDVTPDAELVGQVGQLEIFDRVLAFANGDGEVTHVYITEHAVDAEIYWRVERCFDTETGLTTRVPDENGVYTIAFSHDGQLVDLKCRDAELVTAIDTNAVLQGQFALVFDAEGYIIDTVDVGMALRGTFFASDYHVTQIDASAITLTKLSAGNEQGSTKSVTLSQDCRIFQCCQHGCYDHNCGEQVSSLQLYDRVNVYTDLNGEAIVIFVTRRMVDTPMFYNFEPKYGGEAVGSTREKQGGYYVFQMLSDGKVVTVKTADKAIADAIDGRSNRCSGLVLEGNIITRAYDPSCVFGGIALGNRSPLSAMSGSVITVSDPYSGGSWNAVLSPDCKIYNAITGVYGKDPGGEMDLQVGDIVTTFRNYKDEIVLVFVTSRPVQGAKVYYNLERRYNAEQKQTNREPNADGYYEFLMACGGKQVTVKTKSKSLATFIDSQNAPLVGMKVNSSGVVTNAYEVTIALQNAAKTCNYHYVKNLDSKAGTFSTYYLENGEKKNSSVLQQKMASNCVVYNVSNAYESYRGEVSRLKDGDQIQAIMDVVSGEIIQIYIMNRDPVYGFDSYKAFCAHCGKTVTWQPYGGAVIVEEDTHYYACSPYLLRQGIIGKENDGKVCDVVIDLKGKTVNGSGRAFLVYDKLTILDSVGGGKVQGITPSGGTATNGSTVMVINGGELNILGGELTLSQKSTAFGSNGGVVFVGAGSVVNMSGGTITGGTATDRGGNVYNGGTFNMTGGTVEGGSAAAGGNILTTADSVLSISGGTVDGGIYMLGSGKVTLSGKTVIGASGMKIPAGAAISVAGLTEGASVVVDADGIFTQVLTDPAGCLAYFKPADPEDSIEVCDGALAYVKKRPDYNSVDNSPLSFEAGTASAQCPVCQQTVAWTALTADAVTLSGGGHYYLASDITYTGSELPYITGAGVNQTACVHLNGHSITATAHRAIEGKAGTLNIMGNGTVSGSYNAERLFGAGVNMNGGDGILNLIGGTYTKSEACNVSPVLLIRNGSVNMYSGAQVVGVNDSGKCANVVVFNRSFNMYGGKLSGGAGQQLQSNNWSATATAITNIHGGEIVGTVAISGADSKHGTFTMDGGTITGYVNLSRFVDSVITGGTVEGTVNIDTRATNENSSVTVSGAPVITGTGLVIPGGYKLTVGELTADAGILVSASGVFTGELTDPEGTMAYFIPTEGYELLCQDGALLCRKKPTEEVPSDQNAQVLQGQRITAGANAMTFPTDRTESSQLCPVCEAVVTWKPLSGQLGGVSDGQHHHYYLTNTITSQYQFITLTSGTVCLHMNGFNVDVESRLFVTNGDINIMGTGTITCLGTSGSQTGTLTVGNNATASLYGCTVASVAASGTPAIRLVNGDGAKVNVYEGAIIGGEKGTCHGANVVVEKGTFSMYGGTVQNGAGFQSGGMLRGGNIFLSAGTSFYLYAGTVTGGTADQGGNISVAEGTLVIAGGEITGGTATGQGGNIRAYNATVTMTGGTVSGGDSESTANDNLWAAGSTVLTMLGGTVKGTDGATAAGTAINVSQTAVLYLGGDARVLRDDGIQTGNIYIYASATETAALRVLNDWTGTASVRWTKAYAPGDAVDADRGSCGALAEDVFTPGGTYEGTLTYEQEQPCAITGDEGTLTVTAAE